MDFDNKIAAAIIGALLAFIVKEWWAATTIRTKRKMVLELIAAEIGRNIELMRQMIHEGKEVAGKRIYPNYRLQKERYDILVKSVELLSGSHPMLVLELSRAYFEFNLINSHLDGAAAMLLKSKNLRVQQLTNAMKLSSNEIPRSTILEMKVRAAAQQYGFFDTYILDRGEKANRRCQDCEIDYFELM